MMALSTLLVALFTQTNSAKPAGRFQGMVVDPVGAAVPAVVRVLDQATGATLLRIHATNSGAFQTGVVPEGVYSLTFFSPGFRRRDLRNIAIEAGRATALGEIRLDLSGCDAPGTSCDDFGGEPDSARRIIVEGLGPGVDFCVRTKGGSISHVFFTDEVENESLAVPLWYITRTR